MKIFPHFLEFSLEFFLRFWKKNGDGEPDVENTRGRPWEVGIYSKPKFPGNPQYFFFPKKTGQKINEKHYIIL